MAQETRTVRSLIRATQGVSWQRHFEGWWGTFQEGWIARVARFKLDCPLADFTTGTAQLFLSCGQHTQEDRNSFAVSFCNSRRPFWVGAWRANGRNRRSCILAAAVYHSPVYCTASAYCSPPAHLYIMVPTYKPEPPTDWTKHHELMQKYFRDILQPTHAHMVPTNWTRHCGTNILARNANYYMMMKQFLSQIWCVSNNNQGSPQLLHNSSMNTQKIFGV